MAVFVRTAFAVIICVLLLRPSRDVAEALSTTPAQPLCERVDLGTLSVSPMGLGTLNLPLDKEVDDDAFGVLKTASDCGINFVDTAEAVSRIGSSLMAGACCAFK
jgi:hypothetical protein